MAEPLLEVKNLQVTYGSGRKAYPAVQNASFTIYKGETFGLVGESGSGKPPLAVLSCAFCPPPAARFYTRASASTAKFPARWTGSLPGKSR